MLLKLDHDLRRRRRLLVGFFVVAIASVVWWGSQRRPADSTQPLTVLDSKFTSGLTDPTIRIGTFNIHGGKGMDGRIDLQRTANCLKSLDFAVLNEVRSGFSPRSAQSAVLGKKLQMASLFAATELRWWHGHCGNGLLSKTRLTGRQVIPLVSSNNHKFRNAVLTGIQHEGTQINILLTHLDTRRDREAQLRAVTRLFLSLEKPALLIGDLNTSPSDPILRELLNNSDVIDAVQSVVKRRLPTNRIDWIITRGLLAVDAGYEETDASDHPVVWAELKIQRTEPVESVVPARTTATDEKRRQ